jgi:ABC-type Fe3+-siderophore transport system permease subunit
MPTVEERLAGLEAHGANARQERASLQTSITGATRELREMKLQLNSLISEVNRIADDLKERKQESIWDQRMGRLITMLGGGGMVGLAWALLQRFSE